MNKHKRLLINISSIGETGRHVCGSLPACTFEIKNIEYLECSKPIDYNLDITIVTHSVLIKGHAKTLIKRQCDRCLAANDCTIENSNVCHYVLITEGKVIDLTDEIREDILIVFPQRFICSESCLGLCKYCGQNLNINTCKCSEEND